MEWFLFRAPSLTCLLRPLYSPHCVSPLPSQPTNLTAPGLPAVSVLSLWIPLPTPPCSVLSLESFCPSYTIYHLTQASVFPGKVFRCPRLATSPPQDRDCLLTESPLHCPCHPCPPHPSTSLIPHLPVTPGLGHLWMDTSLAFALWGICPLGRAPSITWG